jgi:hypothetical protein
MDDDGLSEEDLALYWGRTRVGRRGRKGAGLR